MSVVDGNVNSSMGFKQIATVLASIVGQATGTTALTAVTTADFISQAQTALLTGYDPLLSAITQVLSKTIFSIRPYSAKFTEIRMDSRKWGNHVRKIQFADTGFDDADNRLGYMSNDTMTAWGDGDTADMYAIKKPVVLQTNWYSQNQYQKHYTIFRDQLDVAFSGVDEFQRFLTGVVTTVTDELEQAREEFARSIIANYIGALYDQNSYTAPATAGRDTGRVIKLCTEFCTEQGITTGGQDDTYSTPREAALADANYDTFIKWMFARLAVLSSLMTERSQLFQSIITPTGGSPLKIMRHTPYEKQRLYLFTDVLKNIDTRVLSAAFHDNYLKIGKHNTVNYWQSINTRDTVKVTPSTIKANGEYVSGSEQTVSNIFGVLFDEEAIAMTQGSTWSSPTPFNARGGYSNVWYHETVMGLNDMTEKGVLLLIE